MKGAPPPSHAWNGKQSSMAFYKARSGRTGRSSFGKRKPRAGRRRKSSMTKRSGKKGGGLDAIRRELAALKQGDKQNHTVHGFASDIPFFSGDENDEVVQQRHFVVPVTAGLPPMDMNIPQFAREGYRKKRTVQVTGVTLCFVVLYRESFSVHSSLFYSNSIRPADIERAADGTPVFFLPGSKDGSNPVRLLTLAETGLGVGRDGPYETTAFRSSENAEVQYWSLSSPDGTLLDCPLRKGVGGTVGSADWSVGTRGERSYVKHKGCQTVNQVVPAPDLGSDSDAWATTTIKIHFTLSEKIEFSLEGSMEPLASSILQGVVMLKSQTGVAVPGKGGAPEARAVGLVRKPQVKLYYHSV